MGGWSLNMHLKKYKINLVSLEIKGKAEDG